MMFRRGILIILTAVMALPGCALVRRFEEPTSPITSEPPLAAEADEQAPQPLAAEFQRLPLESATSSPPAVQLVTLNAPLPQADPASAELPQNPFEDDAPEPPEPAGELLDLGTDQAPEPSGNAVSPNPIPARSPLDETLPRPLADPAFSGSAPGGDEDDDDVPFLQVMPIPEQEECVDENPLWLDEVIHSVAQSFPMVEAALTEIGIAEGKALAAWGSFDTNLSGHSKNQPLGFYENYRQGIKLARPLWNGGEVYGGYRIGRGEFEPWYLERETNAGGEFHVG
ncbi:MAG: hypothetical protein AAGF97_05070, partial [Planctomycetota bacterium]